jgi:hypothetical protein
MTTKYKRKSFLLERLMEDGTPEGLPGKATVESIRHPKFDQSPWSDLPAELLDEVCQDQNCVLLVMPDGSKWLASDIAFDGIKEFVQDQREAAVE